ncbi:WW domain-containing adapter protein isoform 2 [Schistosoma japonicum]|uniref:WW domain-containing adapter protein isoform 2 n=2 Tax=Schistosoma japonicum TaxID=6182 RepID=A0A4Z2DA36_SCHJA|nr:WW domain-containing adapter protein isoform 2 [Schistosoma japonicum]
MEGSLQDYFSSLLVFMDHSNRPSNSVNHQTKKERNVHGKPEWQKSAIRTCGYWSEQLSSKGKIYFYNCITEVSQWQKPPEWNLPEMSRRDLLRLLSDRKHIEENNLKRSHTVSESEPGAIKDDRSLTSSDLKRTKYSVNVEVRRPSSSHLDTNLSNHTFNLNHITEVSHGDGKNHVSLPMTCDSRYDSMKKTKLNHLPPRTFTTDDMEISPNSSPLSDSSSTKFPPGGRLSPQRSKISHFSPGTLNFQRPRDCKSRATEIISRHEVCQKSEKSTLYQLVDAIRTSIGNLLEQPPNSLKSASEKLSPTTNGSVYELCKTSVPLISNQTTTHLSPTTVSKKYRQSDVQFCGETCSPSTFNSKHPAKSDSIATYSSSTGVESRNCSVHTAFMCGSGQGLTNTAQVPHSMGDSKRTVSSNYSSAYSNPNTSQAENHRFPSNLAHSVCHNVSHQNSPTVISSPYNTNNTTSVSSASHQTCDSLSNCDLSSRQVDKIIEILAEQAHCKSTTEELNFDRNVSLSSNILHENLKGSTSPGYSNRTLLSHSLQTNHALNRDPINPNSRSQHTQLNDLVQVLKAALHHHTSNHLSTDSATFVQSNNRLDTGSHLNSSDRKGLVNKDIVSTAGHHNPYFSLQSDRSRCSTTNRLATDSFLFNKGNPTLDASASPFSACNFSNVSNSVHTADDTPDVVDKREIPNLPSPTSVSPSVRSSHSTTVAVDITIKKGLSPATLSENDSNDMLQRLEQEAQIESKNFDRLQSVLYGELSAESKKLRALVRISEAKLAIHKEKQTSLQELMDAIEVRKHLPNLSFVDDVL